MSRPPRHLVRQPIDGPRPEDRPAGAEAGAADGDRAARIERAVHLAALLLPLPWLLAYLLPPLNHDSAALLQFAQRWLDGSTLYRDLIDVNPPLIFVLNLVPAAIARFTPISGPVALIGCTIALVAVGHRLLCRILQAGTGAGVGPGHGPAPHAALAALLPALYLFIVVALPGKEFTQREHLMVIAAIPYLVLAIGRLRGWPIARRTALATAMLAAVLFAIKPHFLLIPVLVEAYVVLRRGLRGALADPVPWAMAFVFLLYGAFMLLVTPRYLDFIVPMIIGQYVGLGDLGPIGTLLKTPLGASTVMLAVLAVVARVVRNPIATPIVLAALAGVVITLVQGKGWPYHRLPLESFVLVLGAILLDQAFDAFGPAAAHRRRHAIAALVASVVIGCYYTSGLLRETFLRQGTFAQSQAGQLLERYGAEAARGPVLILSPGIYPHYPFLNYAGSPMAMRFMSLWPIQGAYSRCTDDGRLYRLPAQMGRTEAYAYQAVIEDFVRNKPHLVIVDKQPGIRICHGQGFDFLDYFSRDPVFAAHWRPYRLLEEFDRYRIFVRH